MDYRDWFMAARLERQKREAAKAGCVHRYVQAKMALGQDAMPVVTGWTCTGCGTAVPSAAGWMSVSLTGTPAAVVPTTPTAPPEPPTALLADAHLAGYTPFDRAMLKAWGIAE